MSKPFAVVPKTGSVSSNDLFGVHSTIHPDEYTELIQRLFQRPASVAIIDTGFGNVATGICEGIASELSDLGKRVVLISVNAVLQANPLALSNEIALMPGTSGNIWQWPPAVGQPIEFFDSGDLGDAMNGAQSPAPAAGKNWFDYLCENFDSVLLDCPPLEKAPRAAAIAAMAEAAILAVDAARTSKRQILLDQRLLQLSGAKLVGCILINAR